MQEVKSNVALAAPGQLVKKDFSKPVSQPIQKALVTTFAGDGTAGLKDGIASAANFKHPLDVVVTADGIVYIADGFNSCVRRIEDGEVVTFAGNGNANIKDGDGINSRFKIPCRLASDINGNLYLSDAADPRIRKITPAGEVSTYAGINLFGFKDGSVNTAQFGQSFGIAIDAQKNIYITDSQNDCIRKINCNGFVSTIAGNYGYINGDIASIKFYFLKGLVIDKMGNLIVADFNRIRKISPEGIVSTIAASAIRGSTNESLEKTKFSQIEDLVMDEQGNIYFTENNRIRKLTPQGIISTVAGSTAGYMDGDAQSAKFNGPKGLTLDKHGNIYVADSNNNRIRKISFE
ncbi:MAG TPA: hypothetical protein VJ765_15155 [Chitinophagaceae bacterium]|nr:hypothetical protein [Chitinophagaceae bacterium]